MLLISVHDRKAGVAAMMRLARYMEAHPETAGEKGLDVPQTEAELRKDTEEMWDRSEPAEREVFLAIAQSLASPGAYYECHMTFNLPSGMAAGTEEQVHHIRQQIEDIGAKYHFHFSQIDNDEVMGKGLRWYLTRSLSDGSTLANDMNALTVALEHAGIHVARRKIEHIIFDERRDQIAGTGRSS